MIHSWLRFGNPSWLSALIALWVLILAALACSGAGESPPTLQVNVFTSTPVITPTVAALLPTGATITRPIAAQVRTLLDQIQSDRLMFAVASLADMKTRHVLSTRNSQTEGIGAARDWLLAQFSAIRDANPQQMIDVWTQPLQFTWNRANVVSENVVAVMRGTDVGAGVIILGAHYDSISSDFVNGQAVAPGANDNGSGVAALLEIAHILAAHPHRATIIFAAFTAEETGRQGSLAFVKSYLQAQTPAIVPRAMINLDIIGSPAGPNGQIDQRTVRIFSAEPNDSSSRQLARQIVLITNTYMNDVNLVLQSSEERRGRWGDHQSFSAAGYPSVRIIQGLEDLSRQHTANDTIDGVQSTYLMRTTRIALAAVTILADGPTPPTNINLRVKAGEGQTFIWSPVPNAVGYLLALRQTSSLFYDQIVTVGAINQLTGDNYTKYAAVAIAAIKADGEMGPLSPEVAISTLVGK